MPDELPDETGSGSSAEMPADQRADDPGIDLARAALARARASARSGARGRASGPPSGGAGRRVTSPGTRSGAGPDDRDPQTLQSVMSRLLAERGWETEVAVAGALARWEELVGPDLASHCRAESLEDGVLTVVTRSTAWATQVRILAPQLVRRLNEQLGHGTVHRVRVRGPEAPSWHRGGRSVPGRGPRDTYG